MEEYLVDDLEECERLYMKTKDRCLKHWYKSCIQRMLEEIIGSFMAVSSAMENTGRILNNH